MFEENDIYVLGGLYLEEESLKDEDSILYSIEINEDMKEKSRLFELNRHNQYKFEGLGN